MVDGLHVVAVRVEHVGGVVARVIAALAGRAVVAAAGGERRLVERADLLWAGRLKREVHRGDRARCAVDPQFVGGEVGLAPLDDEVIRTLLEGVERGFPGAPTETLRLCKEVDEGSARTGDGPTTRLTRFYLDSLDRLGRYAIQQTALVGVIGGLFQVAELEIYIE